jgi:hypothetical protein
VRRPRLAAAWLVSVACLAGVAAGCGGGGSNGAGTTTNGEEPVVEWANGFCTAVTTWKDQLTKIGQDVVSSPSKDSLDKAVDGVKDANKTLSDDLSDLGRPDTESGQKVKQSVDDLSSTVDTQGQKIQDAVDNASGISGLLSAGATVSASLSAMYAALSSTFDALSNADVKGEMKTAFDQANSCSSLRGSNG